MARSAASRAHHRSAGRGPRWHPGWHRACDRMDPTLKSTAALVSARDAASEGAVAAPRPTAPRSAPALGRGTVRPRRWFRRLAVAAAATLVLVLAALVIATWVDRTGLAFYDRGSAPCRRSTTSPAPSPPAIRRRSQPPTSAAFAAPPLALDRQRPVRGTRRHPPLPAGPAHRRRTGRPLDRDGAVAEWSAYRAGFASVDEVGLHLERVERWTAGGPLTATVRFELIGTPRGEARAGARPRSAARRLRAAERRLRRASPSAVPSSSRANARPPPRRSSSTSLPRPASTSRTATTLRSSTSR